MVLNSMIEFYVNRKNGDSLGEEGNGIIMTKAAELGLFSGSLSKLIVLKLIVYSKQEPLVWKGIRSRWNPHSTAKGAYILP